MRLFELVGQYRELMALEDSEEIPEEVIRDTLEGLSGEVEDKCVAIGKFILDMQASAAAIKEASKAMALRSERLAKRADSLKHYMLLQLQICDLKRIETPELTIRRQSSPPSVVISEGVEVPLEFMFQPLPPPPHPDKKALKEALQSGRVIEGVFIERGEHVRISI
jgi:hypothetical protein